MRRTSDGAREMESYLLGALSEDEEAALEDQYFTDDELFESLLDAETDFVDDLASGSVAASHRERLEQLFLASPRLRERMAFGVALRQAIRARRTRRVQRMLWLAAASVVMAVGGSWLLFRLSEAQPSVRVEQQNMARSGQPAEQATRTRTFVLVAGLVRGASPGANVVVGTDTETVVLELRLEQGDYPTYDATVETVDGREVLKATGLAPASSGESRAVSLPVKGALLRPGDYIVTLRGRTPKGAIQSLRSYAFRVART